MKGIAVEELTAKLVIGVWDLEIRRRLVEMMGHERFWKEAGGGEELDRDTDENGLERKLLRLELGRDEPLAVLEVQNGTLEPDGSRHSYMMVVPPDLASAYSDRCWKAIWGRKPPSGARWWGRLADRLQRTRGEVRWDCQTATAWTYGLLPDEYQVGTRT